MKLASLPKTVRYAGVAILFAISGACLAEYLSSSEYNSFPDHTTLTIAIPFALLCSVVLLRKWWVLIAAPVMVAVVWPVAYFVATGVGMSTGDGVMPGCAGGLVGGFGLVLCAAIGHRRLFSWLYVLGGGVIGSLTGLAFAPFVEAYNFHIEHSINGRFDAEPPSLLFAFAVWQAVVGTYLYAIVHDIGIENGTDEPPGLTILHLS